MRSGGDGLVGQMLDTRCEVLGFMAEGGYGAALRARLHPLGRAVAPGAVHARAPAVHGERVHRTLQHEVAIKVGRSTEAGADIRVVREAKILSQLQHPGSTLRALGVLHEAGAVHRDLGPENVMVEAGGGIRVIDFGLARPLRARWEAACAGSNRTCDRQE